MKTEVVLINVDWGDSVLQYYVKKSFFIKYNLTKEEVESNFIKYAKDEYKIGEYFHNEEGPALVVCKKQTGKKVFQEGRLHGIYIYSIDKKGNKVISELTAKQKELMNERESQ